MKIKVCTWKMCSERFSEYIISRIENDKERFNLKDIEIEKTPCMWNCKQWPNIVIDNDKHARMNPLKTSDLIFKKLKNKNANK